MAVPPLITASALVIVLLICLSAFFSSSETAIFTLPAAWLEEHTAAGDGRAVILADLREDPHRLLVTILVGNNVVNVAISAVATAVLVQYFPTGIAVTAATIGVSFIVLVFGEIVPKSYGLGNATRWSLTVARPLTLIERALFPLVLLFDGITRRINARLGGDLHIEAPYLED